MILVATAVVAGMMVAALGTRAYRRSGEVRVKGRRVLWRSVHDDGVGYVLAARMVADETDAVALFQPVGAAVARRSGRRDGPRGAMLPGAWDGGHEHRPWGGPATVRLHVRGTALSVIRRWDGRGFAGWYLNLELPWRPSPFGYDSRDLVLDVTAADDLSSWAWKDTDQLALASALGAVSAGHAAWVRSQGERAVERLEARAFPFDAAWSRWAPDPAWTGAAEIPPEALALG